MPTDPPEGFNPVRHAPPGMPAAPAHARDAAVASLCRTAERFLMAWGGKMGLNANGRLDDPAEPVRQDFSPVAGQRATVRLSVMVDGMQPDGRWRVRLHGGVVIAVFKSELFPEEQ